MTLETKPRNMSNMDTIIVWIGGGTWKRWANSKHSHLLTHQPRVFSVAKMKGGPLEDVGSTWSVLPVK